MTPKTEAFISDGGARIYRIPIQLFPELWGHVHLVAADGVVALVDVGSGFGESNDHLEFGLEAVRRDHGEAIEWRDLTHVLITHGSHRSFRGPCPHQIRGASGYHRLLALEGAGAYLEYLNIRGHLGVGDLESLERGDGNPIHYQRVGFPVPAGTVKRDEGS